MKAIKILLVDDHAIVRQGLQALLAPVLDIEVVAEAENGRDAIKKAQHYKPDLIVMDFSMPGLNGLEGAKAIMKKSPQIKIIFLTMHNNEEYISQFLLAGASGYLLKDSVATDLIDTIRLVMESNDFVSPSLPPAELSRLVRQLEAGELRSPLEALTNREREVLQLIAEGLTNKGIAQKIIN